MFKNTKKLAVIYFVAALLISYLGFRLRMEKFYSFPPLADTEDEVKAPFNGLSLLNKGVPISWSWSAQYQNSEEVNIRNGKYRMVEPWFDEPPLFSLMMGVYAKTKGINTYEQVDAGVFRYPMIKVAAVSIFILFLILYLLGKPITGLVAASIYATVPTMVLGSRLPISDNMVAAFSLVSILLLVLYQKKKSLLLLIVLGIVSASSLLLKSTGIFIPVGIIFILIGLKQYKAAVYQVGFLILFLLAWMGYGYYYDWNTFITITQISSGRELFQPSNLISLFTIYRIGESYASVDGWLLWGWLAVVAYSLITNWDKKKPILERLIIPTMLGSYLVFFCIMSGHYKGWYRFPFFPFLAWAGAELIIFLIKSPRFLPSLFFLGVPLASSYIFGTGRYRFTDPQVRIFQVFFVLLTAPLMGYEITSDAKIKKVVQLLMIVAFLFAIGLNVWTILYHQDRFWYQ